MYFSCILLPPSGEECDSLYKFNMGQCFTGEEVMIVWNIYKKPAERRQSDGLTLRPTDDGQHVDRTVDWTVLNVYIGRLMLYE